MGRGHGHRAGRPAAARCVRQVLVGSQGGTHLLVGVGPWTGLVSSVSPAEVGVLSSPRVRA